MAQPVRIARLARYFRVIVVLVVAVIAAPVVDAGVASAADEGPEHREIHFPVDGAVSFHDDFGDPRSGGRAHEGNDLMGHRLQHLLAAADGRVSYTRVDAGGNSGNMLTITDDDGWQYRYIHLNNDSPNTDDGLNPAAWIFAAGIERGSRVVAGQHVAYMGDSGNAEGTSPHLHFEIRRPDGSALNPWASLRLARGLPAGTRCAFNTNPKRRPDTGAVPGYWVLGADGGVFSYGRAAFHGSVPGLRLGAPVDVLRLAATRSGEGYWLLGYDGGIFSFGDAEFHGSVPGAGVVGAIGLDLRPTATGDGYWVLGADGGVFSFGDADFHGSVPGLGIRASAIRLIPTPTGGGYWVLGADGGIFSFGDAEFHGSVPGAGVATTVVAMAPTPSGEGYWVLGADGGVFSFGDARFHGSVPGVGLCRWADGVQLTSTPTGLGYWVAGADGTVWEFGDAPFYGEPASAGATDIADLSALPGRARG